MDFQKIEIFLENKFCHDSCVHEKIVSSANVFITPKGPRGVFLQKCSKSAISTLRSPNEFFFTFFTFNSRILHQTTRRTCAKSFATFDCTDCETITLEELFFLLCSAGIADFDCPWCKIFQLCNFGVLHHFNAHQVRYMWAKSQRQMMSGTYSNKPCTKEGYNKFPLHQQKLVDFFVISIFHETKIQTLDMKAQVYYKFRKNKIPKKIKSQKFMKNGRFHTSKCRGKLEKMGALCTHSPKTSMPFS